MNRPTRNIYVDSIETIYLCIVAWSNVKKHQYHVLHIYVLYCICEVANILKSERCVKTTTMRTYTYIHLRKEGVDCYNVPFKNLLFLIFQRHPFSLQVKNKNKFFFLFFSCFFSKLIA